MKTIKTRHLDEIFDEEGALEMFYEYDIYYFSEDGKEFPKIEAKSYTDTAYEVDFGRKENSPNRETSEALNGDDFRSTLFLEAVEYLKKEGKKRIGVDLHLYWSAFENEKPGTDLNQLPYMG